MSTEKLMRNGACRTVKAIFCGKRLKEGHHKCFGYSNFFFLKGHKIFLRGKSYFGKLSARPGPSSALYAHEYNQQIQPHTHKCSTQGKHKPKHTCTCTHTRALISILRAGHTAACTNTSLYLFSESLR